MTEAATDPVVVPINAAVAQTVQEEVVPEDGRNQPETERARNAAGTLALDQVTPIKTESPPRSDSRPPDGAFQLKDIQVGKTDGRGLKITQIYAVQTGDYAIYQAGEVMVQFADDTIRAQALKKSILPVSSSRAEINSLLVGLACREICDRQLAYALQLALDNDLEGAKATAASLKATLVAQRAARGRFQYLKWSYGTAALLIGLLFVASRFYPEPAASDNVLLAAKAGLVGAAFSIALAIRGRTVALDTDLLDNVTDGTLRLVIGVISAGVLLLLFASGILPSLKIGDAEFKAGAMTWQMVLVIGFVGGFLERLVPDLLDKRNGQSNGSAGAAVAGK